MASTEKQKQSLYFPEDMLREMMQQSNRLDRSLSWTVQQAWRIARAEMRKFPSVDQRPDAPKDPARDSDRGAADARPLQPSPQVLEFLRGKFDTELTS